MSVSEAEVQMIDQYSKNIDMQDIGLFWQLTIKTIDDLRIVGSENLTLEMYIMQLIHLKNLDEIKNETNENFVSQNEKDSLLGKKIDDEKIDKSKSSPIKNQLKNTNQIIDLILFLNVSICLPSSDPFMMI